MGAFVYILRCSDGTLYTGWTVDLTRRISRHNQGRGARYTRSRRPVKLMRSWPFATKSLAMREECRIKRLSRHEKLELVLGAATIDSRVD
jgi:putative endonuclease